MSSIFFLRFGKQYHLKNPNLFFESKTLSGKSYCTCTFLCYNSALGKTEDLIGYQTLSFFNLPLNLFSIFDCMFSA